MKIIIIREEIAMGEKIMLIPYSELIKLATNGFN